MFIVPRPANPSLQLRRSEMCILTERQFKKSVCISQMTEIVLYL